ncbi:MAG: 50S ribosomal protein L21 [bacterium]|nr:50S ribosomal protein L21 [bacterium]
MYAVVEIKSKQYTVEEGHIIAVDKLEGKEKEAISFESVLLLNDGKATSIGQPHVAGATVEATILSQERDDKIVVFKFKRKTGYKKTQGHRQDITVIQIGKISAKGGAAKPAAKAEASTKAEAPEAEAPEAKAKDEKKVAAKKPAAKKPAAKKETKE